jgi:hypothetical protein
VPIHRVGSFCDRPDAHFATHERVKHSAEEYVRDDIHTLRPEIARGEGASLALS